MNSKTIMLAVVAALLITGAIVGIQYLRGGSNSAKGEAACGYADCDWTGKFSVQPGDPYPPTCSKCGRAGVLVISTCKKCGNQQILNELLRQYVGRDDLPQRTQCEQCNGPIVHGD